MPAALAALHRYSRHIRAALARRVQRRADRPGVVHQLLPAVLFRPARRSGCSGSSAGATPSGWRPSPRSCACRDRRCSRCAKGYERIHAWYGLRAPSTRSFSSAPTSRPRRRVAFDRAVGMDGEMGAPGRRALSRIDDRRRSRCVGAMLAWRANRQRAIVSIAGPSGWLAAAACAALAISAGRSPRGTSRFAGVTVRRTRRSSRSRLRCSRLRSGSAHRRGCDAPTRAARRWLSTASRRRCCVCAALGPEADAARPSVSLRAALCLADASCRSSARSVRPPDSRMPAMLALSVAGASRSADCASERDAASGVHALLMAVSWQTAGSRLCRWRRCPTAGLPRVPMASPPCWSCRSATSSTISAAMYRTTDHRHPVVNGASGFEATHYFTLKTALEEHDPAVLDGLPADAPVLCRCRSTEGSVGTVAAVPRCDPRSHAARRRTRHWQFFAAEPPPPAPVCSGEPVPIASAVRPEGPTPTSRADRSRSATLVDDRARAAGRRRADAGARTQSAPVCGHRVGRRIPEKLSEEVDRRDFRDRRRLDQRRHRAHRGTDDARRAARSEAVPIDNRADAVDGTIRQAPHRRIAPNGAVDGHRGRGQGRARRGMTNFSAVCVGEKPTTFTSTRPAALPARHRRPLGNLGPALRTDDPQRAVRLRSEAFSFSSRPAQPLSSRRRRSRRLAFATRPIDRYATAPSSSFRKPSSSHADRRHAPVAFRAELCSRDGGCRILSCHFAAAGPRSNVAVPSGNVTLNVPSRATTFDICLNGIDSFNSPLAELQHLRLQPRLALCLLTLEPRRARRFSTHGSVLVRFLGS